MPSPFPGFDPFLEDPAYWSDFHATFINYWREAIAEALPDAYEARIGERIYLTEHEPEARKLAIPDVTVATRLRTKPDEYSAAVALEPVTIPLTTLEGPRETYIEILHRPERSLVAVLELLSPANKNAPGRFEYLAKRKAIVYQNVHLIELDLLRGGERLPMAGPLPAGDHLYFLSRADQRPDCQVYSWSLQDPLPRLPVPLRPPDLDLSIDLATVFNTAYDRGRFHRIIDYQTAPAHLNETERSWALKLGNC